MQSQLDQFQALVPFSFRFAHPMWRYLRAGKVTLCWRLFINTHYSKLCRPSWPEMLLMQMWATLRCLGRRISHQPAQLWQCQTWGLHFPPDDRNQLAGSNKEWPQLSQLHATFLFSSPFADTRCPFFWRVTPKTFGGDVPYSCWFCGMRAFFSALQSRVT